MNNHRPASMVKARLTRDQKSKTSRKWLYFTVAVASLLFLVLGVTSARAQAPRLGLSASPDHYIESIDVALGEEFEIYICVFGVDDDTLLEQDFASLAWVLHQVCCGAAILVDSIDFNPNFQHEGLPSLGVISSSEVCVTEPSILLATLHVTMIADADGAYLLAAGPYQPAVDCEGNNPVMMGMAMVINLSGATTLAETETWDSVKAEFR